MKSNSNENNHSPLVPSLLNNDEAHEEVLTGIEKSEKTLVSPMRDNSAGQANADTDSSYIGKIISVSEEEEDSETSHVAMDHTSNSMSEYSIEGSILANERIDENVPYEMPAASVKRVGVAQADKEGASREKTGLAYAILDTVRFITLGLIIGILLIVFVIQRNDVYGDSMQPTLYDGDAVFVEMISKYTSSFDHGDIVTINADSIPGFFGEEKMLIKRIIGVPGDTVLITDGKVYLNGQLLDEPYLLEGTETTVRSEGVMNGYDNVTLGENEYYCMGDYRGVSNDSRRLGPFHIDRIKAKVLVKVFPFSDLKFLAATPPQ